MRHVLTIVLTLGLLTACASTSRPSAQAVLEVQAAYTAAAHAADNYIVSPNADPRIVTTILRQDNDAYAAATAVRADAQQGRSVNAAKLALAEALVAELSRTVAGAH